MNILADGQPKTSSQIVRSGEGLTQSTVQAVLRQLLAAGYVDAVGITHSGNVLSRTFELTQAGRKGYGIELNPDYYRDGVGYLEAAKDEVETPTLFEFIRGGDADD